MKTINGCSSISLEDARKLQGSMLQIDESYHSYDDWLFHGLAEKAARQYLITGKQIFIATGEALIKRIRRMHFQRKRRLVYEIAGTLWVMTKQTYPPSWFIAYSESKIAFGLTPCRDERPADHTSKQEFSAHLSCHGLLEVFFGEPLDFLSSKMGL